MKLLPFARFLALLLLFIPSRTSGQVHRPPLDGAEMRARIPTDVTFVPNIAYRNGNEAWRLDLCMPAEMGSARRPGLVFVHGGGWRAGDKRRALCFAQNETACYTAGWMQHNTRSVRIG